MTPHGELTRLSPSQHTLSWDLTRISITWYSYSDVWPSVFSWLQEHWNVMVMWKEKLISSINDPLLERKVTRIIKKVNKKMLEMKEKTTSFWFLVTLYLLLLVYILLNMTYLVLVLTRYIWFHIWKNSEIESFFSSCICIPCLMCTIFV